DLFISQASAPPQRAVSLGRFPHHGSARNGYRSGPQNRQHHRIRDRTGDRRRKCDGTHRALPHGRVRTVPPSAGSRTSRGWRGGTATANTACHSLTSASDELPCLWPTILGRCAWPRVRPRNSRRRRESLTAPTVVCAAVGRRFPDCHRATIFVFVAV